MNTRTRSRLVLAAAMGLAFPTVVAHAQLLTGNLSEQATFAPFIGGTNNSVTNNGATNTTEVISTGTPTATPFTITYVPQFGPFSVQLGSGTLGTATLLLHSPTGPGNFFTSLGLTLNYDFDNNGTVDLTQNYTL